MDILYEIMLKSGLQLTADIEEYEVAKTRFCQLRIVGC